MGKSTETRQPGLEWGIGEQLEECGDSSANRAQMALPTCNPARGGRVNSLTRRWDDPRSTFPLGNLLKVY